jgi:hypothetical protein
MQNGLLGGREGVIYLKNGGRGEGKGEGTFIELINSPKKIK